MVDRSAAASVRRTRSLSPVKSQANSINGTQATQPKTTPSSSVAPKASANIPVVTTRPRTVRQTLSTSVATVRVSKNAPQTQPSTQLPPPPALPQQQQQQQQQQPPAPLPSYLRTQNSDNSIQEQELSSAATLAVMTSTSETVTAYAKPTNVTINPPRSNAPSLPLPTVRLHLTQAQFPYPVIAGQTVASVPAAALNNGGISSSLVNSPYLQGPPRVKVGKERKDRGN